MNKLDKQFEQMMKGVRIDSPSSDFTLKVMSRVQAEAAVRKRPALQDYKPVISNKTWIILIGLFLLLIGYLFVTGQETSEIEEPGLWSAFSGSLQKLNAPGVSNVWQSVTGLFTSIPLLAYLILSASMVLWTLDLLLTRIRHDHSKINA